MQVSLPYAIINFLLFFVWNISLIAAIALLLDRATRRLGVFALIASISFIAAHSLILEALHFNAARPLIYAMILIGLASTGLAGWQYSNLCKNNQIIFDASFRKKFGKVFSAIFWILFACAVITSIISYMQH